MNSDILLSWNGNFTPEEQAVVRQQLTRVLLSDEKQICTCGLTTISVFGDWLHRTFDGFVFCECGQILYRHLQGTLPDVPPEKRL